MQIYLQKNLKKLMIIDDETYVTWNKQDVPESKYFHSANPDELENK